MSALNLTDEDIFCAHQEKTDIRLADNQAALDALNSRLKIRKHDDRKLLRQLAQLQARDATLTEQIDSELPNGRTPQMRKTVEKNANKRAEVLDKIRLVKAHLRMGERERAKLDEQRAVVLRHRAALEAPLTLEAFCTAPIRRIPIEILSEIFTLLKPDDNQPIGTGSIPVVAQVGAEWRGVAVAHAALWTSFSCALYGDDSEASLVEAYLQRSRTAPLSIRIYAERRHRFSPAPDRVLASIAARSEYIVTLRLTGEGWEYVKHSSFHGRLPQLELLQLPSPCYCRPGFFQQFELAPRLHKLVLNSGLSGTAVFLPLAQIQSLRMLAHIDPARLHGLLHITSLVCTVPKNIPFGMTPTIGHALLPYLSTWSLDFGGAHTKRGEGVPLPSNFFDAYTTPALSVLEITALTQPSNLSAFLQRSACDLQTLVFTRCSVRIAELLQIFACTPGLDTLAIRGAFATTAITERLLEALTMRSDRPALLPGLKHLVIDGMYAFRDRNLVDMLESRSGTLCSVRLTLNDRIVELGEVERLRSLKVSGMNVALACWDAAAEMVEVV
ncbi:hypothetical protein C8R43DRAFT_1052452 [Mycena crocata]|nr:hypothetical protein C8R43DRAFT_1052452 [Mycena crocata]